MLLPEDVACGEPVSTGDICTSQEEKPPLPLVGSILCQDSHLDFILFPFDQELLCWAQLAHLTATFLPIRHASKGLTWESPTIYTDAMQLPFSTFSEKNRLGACEESLCLTPGILIQDDGDKV